METNKKDAYIDFLDGESIFWDIHMDVSGGVGRHTDVYLVTGVLKLVEDKVSIELSNTSYKPIFIVEGVARIPALNVTSIAVTGEGERYWKANPNVQRVVFNRVPKAVRKALKDRRVRVIVEVAEK